MFLLPFFVLFLILFGLNIILDFFLVFVNNFKLVGHTHKHFLFFLVHRMWFFLFLLILGIWLRNLVLWRVGVDLILLSRSINQLSVLIIRAEDGVSVFFWILFFIDIVGRYTVEAWHLWGILNKNFLFELYLVIIFFLYSLLSSFLDFYLNDVFFFLVMRIIYFFLQKVFFFFLTVSFLFFLSFTFSLFIFFSLQPCCYYFLCFFFLIFFVLLLFKCAFAFPLVFFF